MLAWLEATKSESQDVNSDYVMYKKLDWLSKALRQPSLPKLGTQANVFLFLPYVPTAALLAGDSFFFGQLDPLFCAGCWIMLALAF